MIATLSSIGLAERQNLVHRKSITLISTEKYRKMYLVHSLGILSKYYSPLLLEKFSFLNISIKVPEKINIFKLISSIYCWITALKLR